MSRRRAPASASALARGVIPWRSASQIRGVLSPLIYALRACDNGATIELDIKTGLNLIALGHQLLSLHSETYPMPTIPKQPSGRPTTTVTSGPCPKCGQTVQTPGPINQCACGQLVVNRTDYRGYLYPRRAPNKPRQLSFPFMEQ